MHHLIFRLSDGLFCGRATDPQPIDTEIANILTSELGGVEEDYVVLDVLTLRFPLHPKLLPGGTIGWEETPIFQAEREARERAATELAVLGLTDETIQLVLKANI